jgi:DNA polymerase-1
METSATQPKGSKKLFIVDGHAYAYRAFYAIRQLSSPTGQPTNAIYGFIRMFNKMRAALDPSHVMVVWDGGLAKERMELLPSYKTHRPEMPPALESQLDGINCFLKASGISAYVRDGIEADDWIATLATRAVAEEFSVVIASADKDFLQLVSDRVGLLNPNDKTEKIWKDGDVREKTGVEPKQIVDWLSLIGDSVDNIPGVPGIGPQRAADLLKRFGSIDNLYKNLGEVSSERIRLALQATEIDVRRNQQLIRLHTDLPDEISLESLIPGAVSVDELQQFYQDCGFKTMLRELLESMSKQGELL